MIDYPRTISGYAAGFLNSTDPEGDVLTAVETRDLMAVAAACDEQGGRCLNTHQPLSPHEVVGVLQLDVPDPVIVAFHRDAEVLWDHPLSPLRTGTLVSSDTYREAAESQGLKVVDLHPLLTRCEMALELAHLIADTEGTD